MTAPVLTVVSRTLIAPGSGFADHVSNTAVDFGSGSGRFFLCIGAVTSADATLAHARPGWMRVGSTGGSGGTLMSKDAPIEIATGGFIFSRMFYLDSAAINAAGAALTGTKEAFMACTLADDTTLDGNRKPGFLLFVLQEASGRDLTAGDLATATVTMSGSSATQAAGSPSADAVGIVLVHSDGAALATASAPNALLGTGWTDALGSALEAIQKPGTGSALTIAWTAGTANESQGRHILSLSAAAASSDISGGATLDTVAAAGTLTGGTPSALSGGATLDDVAAAGTLGIAPGVVTSQPLQRNNGTVAASITLDWVKFSNPTTGAQVLLLGATVSTNGSGIFSVANAALATGTTYRVDWREPGGQHGWGLAVAA